MGKIPALSGFAIFQYIVTLAAIAACCLAASQHRIARAFTFLLFTVCVACINIAHLLALQGGMPIALRLQQPALAYAGVCFYLFAGDYCGMPIRGRFVRKALMAFPTLVLLLGLVLPPFPLFFVPPSAGLAQFAYTPGPLYLLNITYGYAMLLAACARVWYWYLRRPLPNVLRHLVVFSLVAVPVPVLHLFRVLISPASGFSPVPAGFALSALAMCVYLMLYHFPRWQLQGKGTVLQSLEDAFILMDEDGYLLDANTRAREYFPKLNSLPPGTPLSGLENLSDMLFSNATEVSNLTLERENGQPPIYLRVAQTSLVHRGKPAGTSYLLHDVSETYRLMQELQQLATLDSLTGLNNRGTFFSQTQRDFDLLLRRNEPASLLMMDIDHFKQVNDEYGHLAGDHVLKSISSILQVRLRHTDITGRYGGEEIAVWLPGATTSGAALIADVIRRALEHTPFESERGRFHVTISIGVAGLDPERHYSLEALIADADTALYLAKAEGRNRVVVFSPTPSALLPKV